MQDQSACFMFEKKGIEAGIIACFLECAESPYLWKVAGIGQTMFII